MYMKKSLTACLAVFCTVFILASAATVSFAEGRPEVMSGHNGYSQAEMYDAVYEFVENGHLWQCDNRPSDGQDYSFDELDRVGYIEYVVPSREIALFQKSAKDGYFYLHREDDGCVYLDSQDQSCRAILQYTRVR